jgi:beta-lactamase regulating signal transducer with metallopeptidase domain
MNSQLVWDNLVAYSMQIGLLVGLAALIPTALGLRLPASRLAYWHILLAACLLLPAVRPWKQAALTLSAYIPMAITAHVPPRPDPAFALSPTEIALILLAVGTVVRLAWLATGFRRLARLRRHSRPLRPVSSWSVEADLRVSDAISSPVTFGFRRPAVLLPGNFSELDATLQNAILCHEILHVRRRDWLFTLAEELVRGVFWFHPAIWWLLGEIGLAREQVVDRQVVELTRSRDEYLDALLAIAGAKPRLDLAPAPLFLRKRHLRQRVVSIMKEVRMSKTRSISSLAAGLGILALACWFVTATFPLAAAPQMVADGPGVTVDTGGAMLHRTVIEYPESARAKRVQGVVTVEATLDGRGNVVDTRVLNGPIELRRAAQGSVLNWHFAVDSAVSTRIVKVSFELPAETGTPAASRLNASPEVARRGAPSLEGKRVSEINIGGVTDQVRSDLMSRLPVHAGDTLAADSMDRLLAVVHEFDEHLNVGFAAISNGEVGVTIQMFGGGSADALSGSIPLAGVPRGAGGGVPRGAGGGVTGGIGGGVTGGIVGGVPSVPPPADGTKRITIGGNVQQAKLISQPKPVYPPLAKQAHVSGVVHLQAIIGKEGNVINLGVISGHPLLIPSAMDAVRQWVYQTTLLNGEPVEVITQIDVNYTLLDDPPVQQ